MQHQQQQQGGGEGLQSLAGYGYSHTLTGQADAEAVNSDEHQKLGDLGIAEAASPISSRPPAAAIEEMMRVTAKGGGEGASGNRWPRQETLALLQIRSEMDAVFRDASSKGPLWEQVSRKLAELGYTRSAKKCKEKFENVHKYYKRTKEGRAGRQDGKNYKFFTQLEALNHNTSAVTTSTSAVQVHAAIPDPTSGPVSLPPPLPQREAPVAPRPDPDVATCSLFSSAVGISFSSDGSSSTERDDEEDDEDVEMESADASRKRKRSHGSLGLDSDGRMMDFFEGLMKQVMQKQEAMQQKFLEAIEKREQERMIREEAWKRQDMARLAREHDLMAQERAISSSRDAAIIAFLQKITGQIIDLPNTTSIPQNPHPPPMPVPTAPPSEPQEQHQRQPTAFSQQQQSQSQNQHQRLDQPQNIGIVEANPFSNTSEMVAAIPEKQIPRQELTGAGSSLEVTSSRWPKEEVLALIQLRSDLESRYQETGPKGPPWEEISAGMQRLGYNRSAKRCKEKWENINKYFKKVRESNKKRAEDSKTCPYFHELDALYRKKIVGNTSESVIVGGRSGISGSLSEQEKQQEEPEGGMLSAQPVQGNESEDEDVGKAEEQTSTVGAYSSTLFGLQTDHDDTGGAKQPEDVLKRQHQPKHGDMIDLDCPDNFDCSYSDDLDHENDQDNYEEVDHERKEYNDKARDEEIRIAYKMQFQRQNVGSTGGGTASTSFTAMVQ